MEDELDELQDEKAEKKAGKKQIQMERVRTAFERLQLAWVRVSLTMMAIGVGGYEYYINRVEQGKTPVLSFLTGRELSIFLIASAFFILVLATLQHRKSMATLKKYYAEMRYSVATVLAYLMLALILFLILVLIIKL